MFFTIYIKGPIIIVHRNSWYNMIHNMLAMIKIVLQYSDSVIVDTLQLNIKTFNTISRDGYWNAGTKLSLWLNYEIPQYW